MSFINFGQKTFPKKNWPKNINIWWKKMVKF